MKVSIEKLGGKGARICIEINKMDVSAYKGSGGSDVLTV